MSFYPDVSPGDPFKPNARLSNDIRHLVNAAHGFQDCRQKSVPFGAVRVSVYNASTTLIPANTAVVFTSGVTKGNTLPVKQAPAGTSEFGIVTRALAPKECGSCIMIGTATVDVAEGTGNFVKPGSDRTFVRASSGTAKILHVSGAKAVILLGGSQLQTTQIISGYAGAFYVKNNGNGTVTIYNISNPSGEYAGQVIVGSTRYNMPVGTLSFPSNAETDIYLTVYYDTTTKKLVYEFATELSDEVTGPQGWYKKLAHVNSSGLVTQIHFCGDIEITGRWWY